MDMSEDDEIEANIEEICRLECDSDDEEFYGFCDEDIGYQDLFSDDEDFLGFDITKN